MASGDRPLHRPGLTPFVVTASLLHGALALHRRGAAPPAPPPFASATPEAFIELTIERDEALVLGTTPDPSGASKPAALGNGAVENTARAKLAGKHPEKPAEAPPSAGGEAARAAQTTEGASAVEAASTPEVASAAEAPRTIDFSLGRLGAGWGPPAPETARGRVAPVDPGARASRELRRAQEERDREFGLGWAGNVLNALYTTELRNSAPPGEGTAQIEIEFGAGGQVKSARVVSGTGGAAGWQKFAELVAATFQRRPPAGLGGARGARAIVEVRMTERFPDGSKPGPSYYGKPCNDGFCVGVESDPSNLGAKVIRLMHASLVHAERL